MIAMKNKNIANYILGIVLLVAFFGVILLIMPKVPLVGKATEIATTECSDTDGGINYTIQGTISGGTWLTNNQTYSTMNTTDICYQGNMRLKEYYCSDSMHGFYKIINCEEELGENYQCSEGQCVKNDTLTNNNKISNTEHNMGLLAIFLGGFFIVAILITIALCVYLSLAVMSIAKKTNTPHAWLAWIPIANIYLMTQIAKIPWWLTFVGFLPIITFMSKMILWIMLPLGMLSYIISLIISFITGIIFIIVFCWIWWKIAEARGKPGWWGLIIILVPIVNLVMIGILAWSKDASSV